MISERISEEYKYKTELHSHSSGISMCSEVSGEKLLKLYFECGADAVVITNHFTPQFFDKKDVEAELERYAGEYRLMKKAGTEYDINVILGIEIRFSENMNDYLVYGIDESDLKKAYKYLDKGIDAFYSGFKSDNNIIFQAHPFRDGMVLANPESVDGVEVFNMHPNHNSRIAIAAKYAREKNFKICGGTDFHHVGHQGCCFIRTKFKPRNSFDIAKVLKDGDFVFDISGNIIFPYYFKETV